MKESFLKIASFQLAILVLLSTFSFNVDKHFCGDFLVDVSFTGDADGCGMNMDKDTTKMKNCCKDETEKIEGQDELQLTSIDKISFEKEQFLVAFINSYQYLFKKVDAKSFVFKEFPPPEISTNFQVAYQAFLI